MGDSGTGCGSRRCEVGFPAARRAEGAGSADAARPLVGAGGPVPDRPRRGARSTEVTVELRFGEQVEAQDVVLGGARGVEHRDQRADVATGAEACRRFRRQQPDPRRDRTQPPGRRPRRGWRRERPRPRRGLGQATGGAAFRARALSRSAPPRGARKVPAVQRSSRFEARDVPIDASPRFARIMPQRHRACHQRFRCPSSCDKGWSVRCRVCAPFATFARGNGRARSGWPRFRSPPASARLRCR